MTVNQISVFLENAPGALTNFTKILADNKVSLRALSLAEASEFGIVRLIVDNVYEATTVLKEAGYIHSLTPVVCVAIPDVPGGLNSVLQVLSASTINVEYMYAFLGSRAKLAYMIFRVADTDAATKALVDGGFKPLAQDEIDSL